MEKIKHDGIITRRKVIPIKQLEITGELCTKCGIGRMKHPDLNIWTCSHCGFSYQIDPNAPQGDSGVKILNSGSYD